MIVSYRLSKSAALGVPSFPGQGDFDPLPEVGYAVQVPYTGDPEQEAKTLRRILKNFSAAGSLIYSTNARGHGIRPSLVLPEELFLTGASEGASGAGVVLVPRFFLLPKPDIDLDDLANSPPSVEESRVSVIEYPDGEMKMRYLALRVPAILESIEEGFRSNRYGDTHGEIWLRQESLRVYSAKLRGKDDHYRSESLHLLNLSSGPYYYFTEEDLRTRSPTEEVATRFAHRLEALTRKEAEGEPVWENVRSPGASRQYDSDQTFLALLTDFDADFLLLGMSEGSRAKLDQIAELWFEAVQKIIFEQYYPPESRSRFNIDLARRSAPSWGRNSEEDFSDGFNDALLKFSKSRKRYFLRGAIENAQRLALARQKPSAIGIESEESILRAWSVFFGESLKGKFKDDQYNEDLEKDAVVKEATSFLPPTQTPRH